MNTATEKTKKYKPYPEYKDSGVDWLGEVPEHWEALPLKRGFIVQLGKMLQNQPETPLDTLEPYLRAANITWEGVDLSKVYEMWLSESDKRKYALLYADLLISEGGDVGRSSLWKAEISPCYIQNAINRVRATDNNSTQFLYYWIYTLKHAGYIDILCNKSTIKHFTAEKVKEVCTLFPPSNEQQAIANFLDRRKGEIDELIAKKERVIELLKEKRTAIISHAVTKGLNPDAKMKDSGVDWLGEIPEHWEVKRLRHIIKDTLVLLSNIIKDL